MSDPHVRFEVRLTPRGGVDRVDGVVDGVLRARVAAPADRGAANASLVLLVSTELAVPRACVHLVAGARGRRKLIDVDGIGPGDVVARWPGLTV
ncbi:MAG: DUF167 domain-containing protein [Candidatus Limnocylindrales bacterium]